MAHKLPNADTILFTAAASAFYWRVDVFFRYRGSLEGNNKPSFKMFLY